MVGAERGLGWGVAHSRGHSHEGPHTHALVSLPNEVRHAFSAFMCVRRVHLLNIKILNIMQFLKSSLLLINLKIFKSGSLNK